MKITKIEAQVKNKGRYSIYVDDKFAFGISELGLIESKIKIGQELSESDLDNLKSESKIDKLYNQTLSLIMSRMRSRWEVEDYLRRKGAEPEISIAIISRLDSKNFINDLEFARKWVENRRLLKPTSRRKLRLELRQKRVSDTVVSEVLEEDDTDDREILKQEILKKRQQSRYQDDLKLMQYLSRQGYNYDDIKNVLGELASDR